MEILDLEGSSNDQGRKELWMEMKGPAMVIVQSWQEMQELWMVMPSTCCNQGLISCGRVQEKLEEPLPIGTSEP